MGFSIPTPELGTRKKAANGFLGRYPGQDVATTQLLSKHHNFRKCIKVLDAEVLTNGSHNINQKEHPEIPTKKLSNAFTDAWSFHSRQSRARRLGIQQTEVSGRTLPS